MLVHSVEWRRRMRREGRDDPSKPDLVDPNSEKSACVVTGFLPLHVAVANGLASMYNFWVDLPPLGVDFDSLKANHKRLSQVGHIAGYSRLTPLQAAAKLGDHRMVQYIVRSQSKINWIWGPVTELHLSLDGIDSLGSTNNDVMELVAAHGAAPLTQEMLLGDFMQGFIHDLFRQKWTRFGRRFHVVMRVFDGCYLVLLVWLLFQMKMSPQSTNLTVNPTMVIVSMVPIIEEDSRVTYLWWRGFRASSGKEGYPDRSELIMLVEWMNSHQTLTRLFGFALTIPACLVLISSDYDAHYTVTEIEQGDHFDALWVPMAFALFFHVQNFSRTLLAPNERLYAAVTSAVTPAVALTIPTAVTPFRYTHRYERGYNRCCTHRYTHRGTFRYLCVTPTVTRAGRFPPLRLQDAVTPSVTPTVTPAVTRAGASSTSRSSRCSRRTLPSSSFFSSSSSPTMAPPCTSPTHAPARRSSTRSRLSMIRSTRSTRW